MFFGFSAANTGFAVTASLFFSQSGFLSAFVHSFRSSTGFTFFEFLRFAQLHHMRGWLCNFIYSRINTKSMHQPVKLLFTDGYRFRTRSGPAEAASLFKSLIQQKPSVSFPYQPFDPVISLSAEQIQYILFIRSLSECVLYLCCQTVHSAPEIGESRGYIHPAAGRYTAFKHLSVSSSVYTENLRSLCSALLPVSPMPL